MRDFKPEALEMIDTVQKAVLKAGSVIECNIHVFQEQFPVRIVSTPVNDPQVKGIGGTMTETEYEPIGETIELRIHVRYPEKDIGVTFKGS